MSRRRPQTYGKFKNDGKGIPAGRAGGGVILLVVREGSLALDPDEPDELELTPSDESEEEEDEDEEVSDESESFPDSLDVSSELDEDDDDEDGGNGTSSGWIDCDDCLLSTRDRCRIPSGPAFVDVTCRSTVLALDLVGDLSFFIFLLDDIPET